MIIDDLDILIVGGGLVGACLLKALTPLNLRVLLVESTLTDKRLMADFDQRSLALSPASIAILNTLNVWSTLKQNSCAIDLIHISQQGYFGSSQLHKTDEPLGAVVEMQYLNEALYNTLDAKTLLMTAKLTSMDKTSSWVTIQQDGNGTIKVKPRLIVAADGSQSIVRELLGIPVISYNYNQYAISANIGLGRPHQHHAYERFTKTGPLALLPLTHQRASLVWSLSKAQADRHMIESEPVFLASLQNAFGYRLGRFTKVGTRTVFPLKQTRVEKPIEWPVVFIGNAANTLHPVAGQGFNLGLRDAATLAQMIHQHGLNPKMLERYHDRRQFDHKIISYATNKLAKIFTEHHLARGIFGGMGLLALDNSEKLKRYLTTYASGFGGVSADLACGIPFEKCVYE